MDGPMSAPSRAQIADVLSSHGLHLRGAWEPQVSDALPALANGKTAAVVWMVGAVGSRLWPAFSASPYYADGLPNPLDRWSRAIAEELAGKEAHTRAMDAGAAHAEVVFSQSDNSVNNDIDGNVFFEAVVTATASGPPRTKAL